MAKLKQTHYFLASVSAVYRSGGIRVDLKYPIKTICYGNEIFQGSSVTLRWEVGKRAKKRLKGLKNVQVTLRYQTQSMAEAISLVKLEYLPTFDFTKACPALVGTSVLQHRQNIL